ncbi:MAG TPA: 30S ribosomal protein S16 [Vicinamibacterales bacterium]
MLTIRLRRVGAKKRPFFRVVVTESGEKRDGKFVEVVGHYYPRSTPVQVDLDRERVTYWLSKGAQPSETVRSLIKRHLPAEAAEQPAPAAQ